MPDILATFEVSKPDKLRAVRAEHPENISFILTTFEVSRPERSIAVTLSKCLNNLYEFAFAMTPISTTTDLA